MRFVAAFTVVLAFALSSCDHLGHGNRSSSNPSMRPPAKKDDKPREGEMTVKQVQEESIFLQGCIERSLGNMKEARLQFQQVLDMDPANAAANYEIAGTYQAEGNTATAIHYAEAAVKLNPGNKWYKLRYADLLQAAGRHDEAIKILTDLSAAEPGNTDLLFRLANEEVKAGKAQEAVHTCDKIEATDGNSDTLGMCRIAAYTALNDMVNVEKTYLGLITSFPSELKYQYALGRFYEQNNMPAKAKTLYAGMETQYPGEIIPHLKTAGFLHAENSPKAFDAAKTAFSYPGNVKEKTALLQSWYPVSDAAKALSAADQKQADTLCAVLRRSDPENALVWSVSGDYLYRENKLKEAVAMYRKATDIDKNSFGTWMNIMELNAKLGDNTAQETDCRTIIDLFPSQPEAFFYLGQIQLKKQDFKHASENLQMAKDYTFSRPEYESMIDASLIAAYRGYGKDEKADDVMETYMKRDSSNLVLMADYCRSLVNRREKLNDAASVMKTILNKAPANTAYLELMGDVQSRLGHTDEAVAYWKKAKAGGGTGPNLDKKINTKSID